MDRERRRLIVNGLRALPAAPLFSGSRSLLSAHRSDEADDGTNRDSKRSSRQKKGQAKSCVFIFLFGGPSHLDLWDMKPGASREIRGEFQPCATSTAGIEICEHLPRLARQMHHVCLLRSMTHRMPVHGPACSEIYTGRPYFGAPVTDQSRPEDWPSLASLVQRFGEARQHSIPHSIVLPWYTQFEGQDRRIAGQTGARMGEQYNPFLIDGNPNGPGDLMSGLMLPPDMSTVRFQRRRELRDQLDGIGFELDRHTVLSRTADQHFEEAAELIERHEVAGVLDLERESASIREHYGRTRFGQSLLLARRLVEAQSSLIVVNWDDDHHRDKVSPHWDTHEENFPKLRDRLCPPFDRAMAAFLQDLDQRGLLETTLVIAVGEFGRTPRIGLVTQNGMTDRTGRDHWPHAFTALVAGGGIRGGQVYGGTTATGAYVKDNPVTPADLSATVLNHLGIGHAPVYFDRFLQTMQPLSEGRTIDLS